MTPTTRPTMDELRAAQDWLDEQRCVVHPGPIETIRDVISAAMSRTTHAGEGMVDDAMVKRACEAAWDAEMELVDPDAMRAALEAALSPPKPAAVVDDVTLFGKCSDGGSVQITGRSGNHWADFIRWKEDTSPNRPQATEGE